MYKKVILLIESFRFTSDVMCTMYYVCNEQKMQKKKEEKFFVCEKKLLVKKKKRDRCKSKRIGPLLLCSLVEESLLASTFVPLQSQCPELVPRPCPINYEYKIK